MNYKRLLDKPKVIAVVGNVNEGKSMLLYNILDSIKNYSFKLFTYGLRLNINNSVEVFSVAELEQIQNSIIVVDELSSLFDLDNRKIKKQIENTLRLINHNNNILILCGVPENFKKFISGKVDVFIYKKVTIADMINGSRVKNILLSYKGLEMGTEILNLSKDKALLFDSKHYSILNVSYIKKYDSKKNNINIVQKCTTKSTSKNSKNVLEMCKKEEK